MYNLDNNGPVAVQPSSAIELSKLESDQLPKSSPSAHVI